jgi:hypothetical protein
MYSNIQLHPVSSSSRTITHRDISMTLSSKKQLQEPPTKTRFGFVVLSARNVEEAFFLRRHDRQNNTKGWFECERKSQAGQIFPCWEIQTMI